MRILSLLKCQGKRQFIYAANLAFVGIDMFPLLAATASKDSRIQR